MKQKKVIILLVMLLLLFPTICFATIDTNFYHPTNLQDADVSTVFGMAGNIVNGLTTIGTVIAVVGLMILGIKYITGSVEQKAEYKKTMIPYLLGCIFIFAITWIVSTIYSIMFVSQA